MMRSLLIRHLKTDVKFVETKLNGFCLLEIKLLLLEGVYKGVLIFGVYGGGLDVVGEQAGSNVEIRKKLQISL